MEITLGEKFPVFKDWINLLKIAGEEHTLIATEEGIKVIGMDPSHVLMVDAAIKSSLFVKYNLGEGKEEVKVGLNVIELSKFLDRIAKDEKVSMRYDEVKARFIIHCTKVDHEREFEMHVMEPMDEEVPEPKILFKANSRITVKAINTALKDVSLVTEHAKLSFSNDRFGIVGEGDSGTSRSKWGAESDDILAIKMEEEATATYTLSYLAEMISGMKSLASVVKVELSTDMPIKVEAECSNSNVTAICYLAPCIGV